MKFRIHTIKFIISCLVAVPCILFALYFFACGYLAAGLIFLAVGCVYTVLAHHLGGTVSVDAGGVTSARLLGRKRHIAWEDAQEAGIIGIKVFNRRNPRSTGPKYIYIAEKRLTRDERFRTALEWPPADMIYMRYDLERLKAVRRYWKEPITLYNTGNLVVDPPTAE